MPAGLSDFPSSFWDRCCLCLCPWDALRCWRSLYFSYFPSTRLCFHSFSPSLFCGIHISVSWEQTQSLINYLTLPISPQGWAQFLHRLTFQMIKLNMSLDHGQRRTSLQLGDRLDCLSKELEVQLCCFSNPQFSHPLNENNNYRNHFVSSIATDEVSKDQFL